MALAITEQKCENLARKKFAKAGSMDEMRILYFLERQRLLDETHAALKRSDYDGADRVQQKNLLLWRAEDKRLQQRG